MAKIFDIYKNHASVYSDYIDTKIEQRNFRLIVNKIDEYNGVTDVIDILDLCCGPFTIKPYIIELMNKHFPSLEYLSYTGVDINKKFIKYARSNSKHHKLRTNFVLADAAKVTLPQQYDTIVATSAYHHISDDRKELFIDNVVRHLTDYGVFLVYEKFIGEHSTELESIKTGMQFYSERILDILKEQELNPNQAFGLANEMYLTAVRDQEYKVTRKEFVDLVSKKGLKMVEEMKLWPEDDRFRNPEIGDFVMVLKK
ncbi:MAG: class I SAM-dependent methyltransferase [Nanoarchaeota archaeon]|nr:class I SAM-dependent methyltransferase [Nanoarchaeota archaeon]